MLKNKLNITSSAELARAEMSAESSVIMLLSSLSSLIVVVISFVLMFGTPLCVICSERCSRPCAFIIALFA